MSMCVHAVGATVNNVIVSNGNVGVFTATSTAAGTNPSYQWKLNGSNVGTNSSSYTNTSLTAADIITCVQTSDVDGCSPSTIYTSNSIVIGDQDPTLLNAFISTVHLHPALVKKQLKMLWMNSASCAKILSMAIPSPKLPAMETGMVMHSLTSRFPIMATCSPLRMK